MSRILGVAASLLGVTAGAARSQEQQIPWERGPLLGDLGAEARVSVPEDCAFTGAEGTRLFMEYNENPTNGTERGTVLCILRDAAGEHVSEWFAVFEFRDDGYVKDEDKSTLDADAILSSIRRGNEAGNEERRRRGWSTLEISGWERTPFYDEATNNLTWAIRAESEGRASLNHSVRLLGRRGVMSVDLVVTPEDYAPSLTAFNTLVGEFEYKPGHRYAEWRAGDKVAAYGLTALVAGGAGAVLLKTGLLQKFGKLIIAAVVAVLAALKGLFFGKKKAEPAQAQSR